jgi:Fe-S oxidoreductase
MTAEEKLLKKMELDLDLLDSGCCGMAGAFGFEAGRYDTSIRVGELVLLPAVRKTAKDTLLLADGFSLVVANRSHRRPVATHFTSLRCCRWQLEEESDGSDKVSIEHTFLNSSI